MKKQNDMEQPIGSGEYTLVCPKCHTYVVKTGFYTNAENEVLQRYQCKNSLCGHRTTTPVSIDHLEMVAQNIKIKRSHQKIQDINRIERKTFREHSRLENACAEYTKELIERLERNKFHAFKSEGVAPVGSGAGVIQLSDLHFNELVDLPHNKYSFEVAAKRLKRFAKEIYYTFGFRGIQNVLIAFTGDIMNSDRRLDELLSKATNRSKATFLAVDLLSQFIAEIATNFNVAVASVTGNEGRVDKEPGWADIMASHNYDWTIHNMLSVMFKDSDVNFLHGDPTEQVVNVAGQNFLLLHGHGIKGSTNLSDLVTKIIGKYAGRGITINYVIFGHIHEASIGDIYSRSSSLVGANAFSEYGLNLLSRASQNVFCVDDVGNINGYKIDLQFTGDETYEIDSKLASYNAKSSDKLKEHTVIHRIVI